MEGLEVIEAERVLVKLADSDCELVVDGTIEGLRDIERLGDLVRVKLLEALTVVETDCESVCETDLLVVVVVEPETVPVGAVDLEGVRDGVADGVGDVDSDASLVAEDDGEYELDRLALSVGDADCVDDCVRECDRDDVAEYD